MARPYRGRRPRRGDIIVFETPPRAMTACGVGGTYIKRVIGLPGDTIREDGRAFIYVNGKKLDEPYVGAASRAADTRFRNRTWQVPKNTYLGLGDNRGFSCDSRAWGPLPAANIIGRAIAIYWPTARVRRLDT